MAKAPSQETLAPAGGLREFFADRRTRIAVGVLVAALGTGFSAVTFISEVRGVTLARAATAGLDGPSVGPIEGATTAAAVLTGLPATGEADNSFRTALFEPGPAGF